MGLGGRAVDAMDEAERNGEALETINWYDDRRNLNKEKHDEIRNQAGTTQQSETPTGHHRT